MELSEILNICNQYEKESIKINILKPEKELSPLASKFGGNPYKPKGFEIPKVDDVEMLLLAQINLSELPEQSILPREGILQFFVSNVHGVYGLDYNENEINKKGFKIVFHEKISNSYQTKFNDINYENFPLEKEFKLSFEKKFEMLSPFDFNFDKTLGFSIFDINSDIGEKICDDYSYEYSKLGGYPFFTQYDPRENNQELSDMILLFQMSSDDDIMWGDCGVGNFFIHPDDLKVLNFDNVFYTWDCC